jgi:hypothetical protein
MKLFVNESIYSKFKYFISVHGVNSECNANMKAMAPAGLLKSELYNVGLRDHRPEDACMSG